MLSQKFKIAVFLISIVAPLSSAMAQVERLPGVVDRPVIDTEIPSSHSLDKPKGKSFEDEPEMKKVSGANEVIATLRKVEFKGNTVLSDNALQKVVAGYLNQPLSKGRLAEIKYEVKKAFYDKGYILVRVVTEPQDFSKGVLKISIFEAKAADVNIKYNDSVNPVIADNIAKRVKAGDIIKESGVESMINDLNDLYDVRASMNLSPGKKLSTTNLDVTMKKENEDVHFVSIDNYGSKLTGDIVANAHLEHSNLFNLGEKLSLDLRRSEDDLWNVVVGAIAPIGIRNLKLETFYLHSENDIVGRLKNLNASGETDIFSLAVSSKLLNTRTHRVVLRTGLETREHKSYLSNVLDTKDNLAKLFLDASYLYRSAESVYYAGAKISKGIDAFDASSKGDVSATRALGEPDAIIFEPVFLVQRRMFGGDGTAQALIQGQLSTNTLLSSDLIIVGGYGSVRGFNVAQGAAEAGYTFSLEYDHVLPVNISDDLTFKAGPFLDGGALYNRVQGSVQDTHLYSAGLGFEAEANIVPAGSTTLRMDWAHPIGSYNATTVSDDTFYISVKQKF